MTSSGYNALKDFVAHFVSVFASPICFSCLHLSLIFFTCHRDALRANAICVLVVVIAVVVVFAVIVVVAATAIVQFDIVQRA